jgi:hypothetical protein
MLFSLPESDKIGIVEWSRQGRKQRAEGGVFFLFRQQDDDNAKIQELDEKEISTYYRPLCFSMVKYS